MPVQSIPVRGFLRSFLLLGLFALQTLAIITTGAVNANGVQIRKEIRDLINDKTSWYLFVQALSQLQAVDQSNSLGYYQLSGIHGRPVIQYDGVPGVSNPRAPGYCTHLSNLFTTWHRPYLALFEQQLVSIAQSIAAQYPTSTRAKYVAAANNLRLPYIDWAKNPDSRGTWPSAFSSASATIITPTGTKTVANPVYQYQFHPNPGSLGTSRSQQFNYWNQTLRCPPNYNVNAPSNNQQAASNVNSWQSNLRDRLYTLITQYSDYNQFSNEQWTTIDGNDGDSIESVHDVFHGAVGGNNGGHMGIIDVSAFDPTFWLHHVMVDRAFALWQVVQTNSWFYPQTQESYSYWYNAGFRTQGNTGLKPFKKDSFGNFWTNDDVRDWTVFQYTYPELQQGLNTDRDSVIAAVNSLYGSSGFSRKAKRSVFGSLRARLPGARPEVTLSGTSSDVRAYTTNIRAQKNALGSSYIIYVFLGDAPTDPSQFSTSDSFVGAQPVLSLIQTASQIEDAKPLYAGGQVPLNTALAKDFDAGKISSLSDDAVVQAYLTANLHWKVVASNGTVLDNALVPGLQIAVTSSEIKPATSITKLPKVGAAEIHVGITKNKKAGLKQKPASK